MNGMTLTHGIVNGKLGLVVRPIGFTVHEKAVDVSHPRCGSMPCGRMCDLFLYILENRPSDRPSKVYINSIPSQ